MQAPLSMEPSDSPDAIFVCYSWGNWGTERTYHLVKDWQSWLTPIRFSSPHPHSLWLPDSGQASLWSLRLSPLPVVLGLSDKFPKVHSLGWVSHSELTWYLPCSPLTHSLSPFTWRNLTEWLFLLLTSLWELNPSFFSSLIYEMTPGPVVSVSWHTSVPDIFIVSLCCLFCWIWVWVFPLIC